MRKNLNSCTPTLFQAHRIWTQVQRIIAVFEGATVQSMAPLRVREACRLRRRKLEVADFHEQQSMLSAKPQSGAIQCLIIAPWLLLSTSRLTPLAERATPYW
jgi:hypothetical protein